MNPAHDRKTFAIDGDKYLIEEPCLTQVSLSMPYVIGVSLTKYQTPLANSLIGDNDTPSGKDFLDITKAKRKCSYTAWLMISAG